MNPLHKMIDLVRQSARQEQSAAAKFSLLTEKQDALMGAVFSLAADESQSNGERLAAVAGRMAEVVERAEYEAWLPLTEEAVRLGQEQTNRLAHFHKIALAHESAKRLDHPGSPPTS